MGKSFWFTLLGVVASALGLAVIAGGVWLILRVSSFKDVPEEKWTCIDRFGYGHDVVWDAKYPGTNVYVESAERVELFAFSCLPNPKSNCFDNDGWGAGRIEVTGGPAPVSFAFDHDSQNVDGESYRHHVRLYWALARDLIAAFRAGKEAEITTLGRKGEVLKVTKIKLAGFGPQMDKCLAIWAKGEAVSALARP